LIFFLLLIYEEEEEELIQFITTTEKNKNTFTTSRLLLLYICLKIKQYILIFNKVKKVKILVASSKYNNKPYKYYI